MTTLLPRARVRDVLARRASWVGARLDASLPRGVVSPVEPRLLMGSVYGDLAAEERAYFERRSWRTDAGILLRWSMARMLAPRQGLVTKEDPWVVSARLDNLAIEEALDRIFLPAPAGRARIAHFAHAHCLNLASRDSELALQLSRADLTLGDGAGIRIGAALLGIAMRHNLNGTDLWPLLIRRAVGQGMSVALVGAAPGVALLCAERIRREFPGVRLAAVADGFRGASEPVEVLRGIRAGSPCLVLVAMGSPLQERWTWTNLAELPGVTAITVGGLFDFMSQRVPRAPQAWRDLGLEWAYRLIQEPRRLWRRYLIGNFVFLFRVLRQRFEGKR